MAPIRGKKFAAHIHNPASERQLSGTEVAVAGAETAGGGNHHTPVFEPRVSILKI